MHSDAAYKRRRRTGCNEGKAVLINRREVAALALALPLAAPLSARLDGAAVHDLAEIERIAAVHAIASVSLAIGIGGKVVWKRAFGFADRERLILATSDTLYSLASVTKPLTAVALLMLNDEGLVDLDAPANEYLGAARITSPVGSADQVTLRRLLNHTSGLPPFYSLIYADQPFQRRPIDEVIARFGRAMVESGAALLYSNLGFGVIERVIERVSGKAYPVFMRDAVFTPLGLGSGQIATGPALPKGAAARYMTSGRRVPFYVSEHRGAADAFMCAPDLARFGMFYLDAARDRSRHLSAGAALSMQIDHSDIQAPDNYYGLGLNVEFTGRHRTMGHVGSMPGAASELLMVPDRDLVVALVMNQANGDARRAIMDHVLARFAPASIGAPLPGIVANELAGRWAGTIDLLDEGRLPLGLHLQSDRPWAELGGRQFAIGTIERKTGGYFNLGLPEGQLPSREARRTAHQVLLKLRPDGQKLTGYALSAGKLQADRDGLDFPYWTKLRRVGS